MKNNKDYMPFPELADLMKVNNQTLRNWINSGVFIDRMMQRFGKPLYPVKIKSRYYVTEIKPGEAGISTVQGLEEKGCSPIEDKSINTTSCTAFPSSSISGTADLSDVLRTLSELAESQKMIAKAVIELKTVNVPKKEQDEIAGAGAGALAVTALPALLQLVDSFNDYMEKRQALEEEKIRKKIELLKMANYPEPETEPEPEPEPEPVEKIEAFQKKLEQAQTLFNMLYPVAEQIANSIKMVKK